MTIDERLDRPTRIVEPLAGKAVARNGRIEALIQVAERHERETKDLVREWQALRTLPRQ
jgi:hypothetical protein